MSNSTPEISSPPVRRRWHWTTWVLGVFVLLVCGLLNVAGDFHPWPRSLDYGWPETYANDTTVDWLILRATGKDCVRFFRPDLATKFRFDQLAINGFVSSVLVVFIAAAWEFRLRKRKRLWRVTIADWFGCCFLIACGHYGFTMLYNEQAAEQSLKKCLARHHIKQVDSSWHQMNVRCLTEPWEIPYDWFWQSFDVPPNLRPQHRVHLEIEFAASTQEATKFPPEAVVCLQQLKHLQYMELTCSGLEYPRSSWPLVAWGKHIHHLAVHKSASLCDEALGTSTDVITLTITQAPAFHGHRLAEFVQATTLVFDEIALDDLGLEQIAKLKTLQQLTITGKARLTDLGWQHLRNINLLKRIALSDELSIGRESLLLLAELPKLEEITVHMSKFNSEWVDHLAAIPRVRKAIVFHGELPAQRLTFNLGPNEAMDEQGKEFVHERFKAWKNEAGSDSRERERQPRQRSAVRRD